MYALKLLVFGILCGVLKFTNSFNCYIEGQSILYSGNTRETIDGNTCVHWIFYAPDSPFLNRAYVIDANFPDGSVADASNYCRNPNNNDGPWCFYDTVGNTKLCDVNACTDCMVTPPANGIVTLTSVAHGTTTTYSCTPGYTLSGSAERTCVDGSLTPPTCNGDPCTATDPSGGTVSDTAPAHGTIITYECTAGYSLVGATALTCTAGTLSFSAPTCEEDCKVTAPTNGRVDPTPVLHDGTARYSCDSGFTRDGTETRTCMSGTLTGIAPTCEQDCIAVTPVNGNVNPIEVPHDSSTTYSCDDGYSLDGGTAEQTCQNGAFSSIILCKADCSAFAPENGGAVTPTVVPHGTTATYSCPTPGYTLSGIAEHSCDDGSLTTPLPTCDGDPCEASAPIDGTVSDTAPSHGTLITYECTKADYTLIGGMAEQMCTAGQLSDSAPTCEQDCTAEAPGNGGVNPKTVSHDASVTYDCDEGYTLVPVGSQTRTCSSGTLSGSAPTCQQDCEATAPSNGMVDPITVTHGSSTTFSCDGGYSLVGTASRTCTSGILDTVPTCEQDCEATAPTNGMVDPTTVTHGSSTTYYCNEGYSLVGTASRTCTSGSLEDDKPMCSPDGCTASPPDYGDVTRASMPHGASTMYSCTEEGYTLIGTETLTCILGSLSPAEPPVCQRDCMAEAPTNGAVTSITVIHGESAEYSCDDGYSRVGSETRICSSGTLFGDQPTCLQDTCSATAPTNGAVTDMVVVEGESTTYSCTTGFSLDGTTTQACTSGSLVPPQAPTCKQDCTTSATVPDNGAVSAATTVHGATVIYTCVTGYMLKGTSTATCDDGTLSPVTAMCSSVPVFAANTPANVSVAIYSAIGTNVTSAITATGDAVLTYSLTSQIPDSTPKIFNVDASSGLLTIDEAPGFRNATSYTLIITATSSKGTASDVTDDTSAQHVMVVSITGAAVMGAASILMITLLSLAKYL